MRLNIDNIILIKFQIFQEYSCIYITSAMAPEFQHGIVLLKYESNGEVKLSNINNLELAG